MNAEELAAEFDKKSQNCAVLRDGSSHASPKARLDGKREAYAHCAVLIRKHLCTPLDAAAPDMLAVLEEVMTWIEDYPPDFVCDGKWFDTQDRVDAAIAKAKGTPDVN